MWRRVLGVAVVLLCGGFAVGYAAADRDQDQPRTSTVLEPVPAVSPSVPAVPEPTYEPDPDDPPLTTVGLVTETVPLRLTPDGAGVKVDVPVGWRSNRVVETNQWNFVDPARSPSTYLLRVTMWRSQNVSPAAAMAARIASLEIAEDDGGIADFQVTEQTADTFEATYVDGDRLRFTTERWVSFDGGGTAYASVAVTGREVDLPGMGDLLGQTINSLRELKPEPAKGDDQP